MEEMDGEPPAKKSRPDVTDIYAPGHDRTTATPYIMQVVATQGVATATPSVSLTSAEVTSTGFDAANDPVSIATSFTESLVTKDAPCLSELNSTSEIVPTSVVGTSLPVAMVADTLTHSSPAIKLQEQTYPGLKLSTAVTVTAGGGPTPQLPKPIAIVTTGNIRPTLQLLTVQSDRKQTPKPLTDVQVKIEIGHQSTPLATPNAAGDTHEWLVFIRGADNYNISFFVEKVVFILQSGTESQKTVCRDTPFQMGGSSNCNVEMAIKLYFKNKIEQKKVKFVYTVTLATEPVNNVRIEKIAFQNPSEEFRKKVLKAGGMIVGPSSPVFSEGQWTGDGKIRLKIAPAPLRPPPVRSPGITLAANTAPRYPAPQVVTISGRQPSPTSILSKTPLGHRISVTDVVKPQPSVQIVSPGADQLKVDATKPPGTTQISFQVPVNWTSVGQGSKSLLDSSQKVSLVPLNPTEAKSLLQDSKQVPKNGVPVTKTSADTALTATKTYVTGNKMVGNLQPAGQVITQGPAGLVSVAKPPAVVSNSTLLQSMNKPNQVLISNKPFTLVPSNQSQVTQIVKTDKKLNKGKITMAEAQIMLPSGPAKISWPVQPQMTTIESKQIVITNPMLKTTGSVLGAKSTCIVSQPPRPAGTSPSSAPHVTKFTTLSSIMPTAKIVEMNSKVQAYAQGIRLTPPRMSVLASQRNWELVKQSPQLSQQHPTSSVAAEPDTAATAAAASAAAKIIVKEDKELDKRDDDKSIDTIEKPVGKEVCREKDLKESVEETSDNLTHVSEDNTERKDSTAETVLTVKDTAEEKMDVAEVEVKQEEVEEVMETEENTGEVEKNVPATDEEDFNAVDAMNWKDGVGELPGSNLKFRMNDLGVLEVITDDLLECNETLNTSNESETADGNDVSPEKKTVKTEPVDTEGTIKTTVKEEVKETEENVTNKDEIVQCENCKEYGFRTDFYKAGRFCSKTCIDAFNNKRIRKVKKHADLSMLMLGLKRGRKKLLLKEGMHRDREQKATDGVPQGKKLKAFVWTKYLEQEKAVEAPARLFKNPFPAIKNHFRVGMRLEGIDPMHQSLFCALSVAEVSGYRIRLHFDGYSECYDFWLDIDSPFIFPCGFCEKNGKVLQPPKGLTYEDFTWASYLKMTKAVSAPKTLFSNQPVQSVLPNLFRVGSKLEAVDKKNSSLICVASVADTLGDKVLIHFDSWDDNYDYWCDTTAPYIHAAGYCEDNKYVLSPPIDWKDPDGFTWEKYFTKTKSQAVPARALKPRTPVAFEEGMKVEVVDKRNPILVRVATISEVDSYLVKIHFDGWSDGYDYWLDDDSPDLHPPGWCAKTGHPLVPPISPSDLVVGSGPGVCPTPGCKGIGHIKGAKYSGHHSTFGCPYSDLNMNKETVLTDRLGPSCIKTEEPVGIEAQHTSIEQKRSTTEDCDSTGHVTNKVASNYKASACTKLQTAQLPGMPKKWGRGRRPKSYYIQLEEQRNALEKERIEKEENLRQGIHNSVFSSAMISTPKTEVPLCWEQHCKLLPGVTNIRGNNVSKWTIDQVAAFVNTLPGCEEQAKLFKEEQIDGEAFLLLTQADIVKIMNIKLGPALKIFNSIVMFKNSIEV